MGAPESPEHIPLPGAFAQITSENIWIMLRLLIGRIVISTNTNHRMFDKKFTERSILAD